MKYLSISVIGLFLISCAGEEEMSDSTPETSEEVTTTDTSSTSEEVKEELSYTIEVDDPVWEDHCFPYPNDEFKKLLETESVPDYGYEAAWIYAYVVAHFDSLGPRVYTPMEDEYDMGVYDWSQEFSDGVTYSEFFGGEGGATATIQTGCTEFEAVFSTVNALVNRRYVGTTWEREGFWNEERTEYAPEEGAGCYYNIILDDSTGYYKVENYCGC